MDKVFKQIGTSRELYVKFAAIQGYLLLDIVALARKFKAVDRIVFPSGCISKCREVLEPLKQRPEIILTCNRCLKQLPKVYQKL